MSNPIENYGLIGDGRSAALVSSSGSIDWLCLPRFDSSACFAALLGTEDHGCWSIAPRDATTRTERRYRRDTLILETDFSTESGEVRVTDFMSIVTEHPRVYRMVEGRRGSVAMHVSLRIRFDYGSAVPWVRRVGGALRATAGPDTVFVHTDLDLEGRDLHTVSDFEIAAGERRWISFSWVPTHDSSLRPPEPVRELLRTESWWRNWCTRCAYSGPYREEVVRSLLTLKALFARDTGGMVAAPTTSLPEQLGGERNWDYRVCWLRDATFTIDVLSDLGYLDEAAAWRDWLVNAIAGTPWQAQIMYGIAGERRLSEFEIDSLPGYAGSEPVRVGNAAANQFQIDVYGEVVNAFHTAHVRGLEPNEDAWRLQRALLDHLAQVWNQPDRGIWEVRGPARHFVHSKVMAWVAFDRAVRTAEALDVPGDRDAWRTTRDAIRAEILERGIDQESGSFVQHYETRAVDASLLVLPLVGFLPATDDNMRRTVERIRAELADGPFVWRYRNHDEIDELEAGEGAFLMCSFWLIDNLVLMGRADEARRSFESLLAVANDLGLLAEQYGLADRRLLGNYPQAFSHVALLNSALLLNGGRSDRVG